MPKLLQNIRPLPVSRLQKSAATENNLSHLAFDHVAQANLIIIVSTGKIIMANKASCKLLGYSKKELLSKNRSDIFDSTAINFKKMIKERTAEGKSSALVTAIKKSGKSFSCEITSAVFTGGHGKIKSITNITDISQRVLHQKNMDTEKEKLVADNIVLAQSKQKAIDLKNEKTVAADIITAQLKSDTRLADNVVLSRSKQKAIDLKNEKTVAADIITAQIKSDNRLADSNAWIKYIAETSYDVMWDWDIEAEQIYVGESIREIFGYRVKNNRLSFAEFCRCLVEEEKEAVEQKLKTALASGSKSWNDTFKFKRHDGSIATTVCRGSIVRDDAGRAIHIIGALQDISRLHELENKLDDQISIQAEQGEKFLLAAKLSFDVIWDWNLATNEVFIGEGFEELFGYPIKANKGNMIKDWTDHMHPDDKEEIKKELHNSIKSSATEWEHAYRVTRADGSIAKVHVRASIIRDADGRAYRMIGAMQDLSRQNELEEKLDHEIRLKEKQITEAADDARELERTNIGKELHDNINQLLGASRMYLEMSKKQGKNRDFFLSRSTEYTVTAIEEIRKLTKGLTTDIIKSMGLCIAIDNLAVDMSEVNPIKITWTPKGFNEKTFTDKFKLNIFRIVQEQLNNILKHARATKVTISLSQTKKYLKLAIDDNGIGFDTCKKQTGIGLDNIKSRAASYNGIAGFSSEPGKGCRLTVTVPVIG